MLGCQLCSRWHGAQGLASAGGSALGRVADGSGLLLCSEAGQGGQVRSSIVTALHTQQKQQ
jgi:hypothetical protein